jgi:hypothetical protein
VKNFAVADLKILLMDIYSITLAASIAALGIAVAAAVIARFRQNHLVLHVVAKVGAALALVLGVASGVTHLLVDHRPGTPAALGWTDFMLEHPVLAVVGIVGVLIFLLQRRNTGA